MRCNRDNSNGQHYSESFVEIERNSSSMDFTFGSSISTIMKPAITGKLGIIIVELLLYIQLIFGASFVDKPCSLMYNYNNIRLELLNPFEPLANLIKYDQGIALVPNGKQIRLECIDEESVLVNLQIREVNLLCNQGIFLPKYNDNSTYEVSGNVECSSRLREAKSGLGELIRNGACENNATNIDVHVSDSDSGESFLLYSVCFDETTSTTLYSKSFIDGKSIALGLGESGKPRPGFKNEGLFPFNVNLAYTQKQEKKTLTELLGPGMFEKYVPQPKYYLSRGHLFPSGDPIYKYQKDATFFYINVVPQWQILNNGNWKVVEESFRKMAEHLKNPVTVYTGTYGVLQLKDYNKKYVELWMGLPELSFDSDPNEDGLSIIKSERKQLPVPKFMWKVAHSGDAAVVVVQINNPWAEITKNDLLCEDICDQLDWFTLTESQRRYIQKGFTYCCDLNALREKIITIPKLKYSKILNPVQVSNEDLEDEYSYEDSSDSDYRGDRQKTKRNRV